MFTITGFDKDNGYHIDLLSGNDCKEMITKAKRLEGPLSRDELKNPFNGEPLDWIEVVDSDGPGKICWASYWN